MIKLNNIHLNFKEDEIFQNFNMHIKKSEKVQLEGDSGSGKSTLIKMLLGFIKPDSGEIIINEKLMNKQNILSIRKDTAYIPQQIPNFNYKVETFIRNISELDSLNFERFKDNILEYLRSLKLDKDFLEKDITELSGGEKQRLFLSITIAMDKEIMILDEVFAGLDKKLREIALDLVLSNKDKTVLMTTHNILETNKLRVINIDA